MGQVRAGVSHWLLLLVLCKGVCRCAGGALVYGSSALGMGRMNLEPPLNCRGEVQPESVSMAGGHGRDHGVLG